MPSNGPLTESSTGSSAPRAKVPGGRWSESRPGAAARPRRVDPGRAGPRARLLRLRSQGLEVTVHAGQPVRPVTVLGEPVPEGDVRPVDPRRGLHDGGEGVPGGLVGRDRRDEVARLTGPLVEGVGQPGPVLPGEEAGELQLDRDVDGHPAETGRAVLPHARPRLPQGLLRLVREPLEPFRGIRRGVAARAATSEKVVGVLVDPVEQGGVERADPAEGGRLCGVEGVVVGGGAARDRHVDVHLGPVAVVRGTQPVHHGHEREHPAGGPQRTLHRRAGLAVLAAQEPAPRRRVGVRVVEQPAPEPVGVGVLLPVVAAEPEGRVGVRVAPARLPGVLASLEEQRLAELHAQGAPDGAEASVAGGQDGVTPQQEALGARPEAEDQAEIAILAEEVAVAVAGEAPLVRGDRAQTCAWLRGGLLHLPH